MTLKRGKLVPYAFALALVLVIGTAAAAYLSLARYSANRQDAYHTYRFLDALDEVLSTLKDAETGERGYLITGKEEYLEPYKIAQRTFEEKLDALEEFSKIVPSKQEQFQKLETLINKKLEFIDRLIELRRKEGSRAATHVVMTDHGKELMDQIRRLATQMKHEASQHLEQKEQAFTRAFRTLVVTMTIGNLFAVALVAFGYKALMAQLRHRQRAELALQEANIDLKKSVDFLKGFTYSMAHDLRAPVRAMKGFSQVILDDYGKSMDAAAMANFNRIKDGAELMDQLVIDLLAYAELASQPIELTQLELDSLIDKILLDLTSEIKSRRAEIDIQRPLPTVCADPLILSQVIIQLLTNAMKFVSPGNTPKIRIYAQYFPGFARLVVEDNGLGIPPEYQEKIFEVFHKLETQEDFPGTGIGLAIVKKGAERMAAKAGVESSPGKGSRFWVELPDRCS